ncbi:MAG TPA: zinc-ribbon domain-containing protein [Terriglobales bacterium]|nr:zinc-ribbon domain-containing protein [Terriglobales bacterium]
MTEKLQEQKRFFCDNCKREVFFQEDYCGQCGGKIDWPQAIQKTRTLWAAPPAKKKRFHFF